MSSAFELLRQAEVDAEQASTIPSRADLGRPIAKGKMLKEPGNYFNEEISRLVQTMFLSGNSRAPRQLVFCGVDDGKGSTIVCANTGRALAARGESVCLLDAHAREPRLARFFGVEERELIPREGLATRERCVQLSPHLCLAGANMVRDDSGALASVTDLKILLAKLQGIHGTVLIDAPATGTSRDAALLGQVADAAILVIEANKTRKIAARKAKEFLERSGVQLLGSVLNNRTFPIPEALYRRL